MIQIIKHMCLCWKYLEVTSLIIIYGLYLEAYA